MRMISVFVSDTAQKCSYLGFLSLCGGLFGGFLGHGFLGRGLLGHSFLGLLLLLLFLLFLFFLFFLLFVRDIIYRISEVFTGLFGSFLLFSRFLGSSTGSLGFFLFCLFGRFLLKARCEPERRGVSIVIIPWHAASLPQVSYQRLSVLTRECIRLLKVKTDGTVPL
jgi:hypothetical protein